MKRVIRYFTLTCQLLAAGHTSAQAPALPSAPSRAVAVLVDVSASVSSVFAGEARDIVKDIVTGKGFLPGNGWVSNYEVPESAVGEDVWPEDEGLKAIYAPYWSGGSQPLKPLTGSGKVFYLGSIGEMGTTVSPPRLWDISSAQEFGALLETEYPRQASQFKDQWTCYYIGVARTADRLLQRSEEGCYLFVVSDEWDDPDSAHPKETKWKSELESAGIYERNYEGVMVKRFHDLK
ncbi:MAG TPA: hypothetical protein VHM91_11550, partial [Verrucomicrobiales bacterium]|nr:hypothetical protein [Verrucomicrobiales bacterium]